MYEYSWVNFCEGKELKKSKDCFCVNCTKQLVNIFIVERS